MTTRTCDATPALDALDMWVIYERPLPKYFLIDEAGTKLARLSDPRFIRALTLR